MAAVYLLYRYLAGMEWTVVCVTQTFLEAVDRAWATHGELDQYRIEEFVVNATCQPRVWDQRDWDLNEPCSYTDFLHCFKARPSKGVSLDDVYGSQEDVECPEPKGEWLSSWRSILLGW